jgi:DNA-binding beta-propeller fold protein YncE
MRDNVDDIGAAARFDEPTGIAFDGDHTLYVADRAQYTLRSVDMTTKQVTTIAGAPMMWGGNNGSGSSARFGAPTGLVYDRARSRLYVAEEAGDIRVVTFNPVMVAPLAGQFNRPGHTDGTFVDATFIEPVAMAYDPAADALYVADYAAATVRKLDLSAQIVTTPIGTFGQSAVLPGALPASLNTPAGLAVLPGVLIITSYNENDVLIAR